MGGYLVEENIEIYGEGSIFASYILLDETYIHQNYAPTEIWQDKEDIGGLKVPMGKDG